MKKLLITATVSITCIASGNAQVTVKKDVLSYYTMLPTMPSSLQDAYQKCTCKNGSCSADSLVAPLKRSINADAKAMGTLTETEKQEVQKGTQLGKQMQADNVQGMNDNQKLDYVKNNPQLNGGNPDAIAFAQKMKNDPSEKAKLQAMTPDQKLAYLQANGVLNGGTQSIVPPPSTDSGKATDAMRQQKQMQATESSGQRNQLTQALSAQCDASTINAAHGQIDQQEQAELNKVPSTGEGGPGNTPAVKAIRSKYMQQHLTLASTEMQNMVKAYQDLYNFFMNAETPFCNSLKAINYGYTGDPNQDQEVTSLAIGQSEVMGNVESLADYAKSIYEFGARWQAKSLQQ